MKKVKIRIRSIIIGTIVGLIAGAALILTAFAYTADAEDTSERVVQAMDADGAYMTAKASMVTDVLTDEIDAPEADSEESDEDEEIVRTVEVLGADKNYLSSMSPEEIKSLSSEALENEGLDSSVADGSLVTRGITFTPPEGFFLDPEYPGMYVTNRYPIDASNFVYSELDADYTLQLMDRTYFEDMVEQCFLAAYGVSVDVRIDEYTDYTIDDVPAIRVRASYDIEDNHVESLMIIVNGSSTYTFIYTQNQDYDRMDLFEASAASIHVTK